MASKVSPNTVFNPVSALGVDKDGNYTVLRVDDVGRLQVGGQAQLFAYGGQVLGYFSVSNTAAQAWILSGDTVPSGEVWVFTCVEAHVTAGTWSALGIFLYDGTYYYTLNLIPNPSVNQSVAFHGQVPAVNPQLVRGYGVSTASGGNLVLNTIGYKIKLLT